MGIVKFFVVFFLLSFSVCSQPKPAEVLKQNELKELSDFTIRYIANEGVLISAGEKQILIDGLHREYKRAYAFPPPNLQKLLENAQTPYDKINLLLVSHIHLDHFHPDSIGSYLRNNPKAMLISSEQVTGEVTKSFTDYEKIKDQIKPVTHEWKKLTDFERDDIKIKFLGLRHANAQHVSIQNLGHLIEIGCKKLLHIGDADMTEENFSAFNLAKEKIDVAFIPYWFLLSDEGRALVKNQFAPKTVVAVHISPNEAERISAQLKKDYPDVIAFTKLLEETGF